MFLVYVQLLNYLWQSLYFTRVIYIVFIVINFDFIVDILFIQKKLRIQKLLEYINIRSFLISRQNNFINNVKISMIIDNHFKVAGPFHMVFASVFITADMGYFFVFRTQIVLLSLLKIILIRIVVIRILVMRVFFSNLKNDLVFLFEIQIIGVDQHKLIVICYVIVLINFFVFFYYIQNHFVFLY